MFQDVQGDINSKIIQDVPLGWCDEAGYEKEFPSSPQRSLFNFISTSCSVVVIPQEC